MDLLARRPLTCFQSLLAAGALILLAACGAGSGDGSAVDASSAGSTGSTIGPAAVVAPIEAKAVHALYSVTPIVLTAEQGRINPVTFILAEGGQVGLTGLGAYDRSLAHIYWRSDLGAIEIDRSPRSGGIAAINRSGQVVGTGSEGTFPANPYLWTQAGGLIRLEKAPLGGQALGISDSGLIIGNNGERAAWWNAAGVPQAIATQDGNKPVFVAMNPAGLTVGYYQLGGYRTAPFTWSTEGGAVLMTLPGGIDSATPVAIGEGGQVVGFAELAGEVPRQRRPFIATAGGTIRVIDADLGNLGTSYRYGVSRAGAVVSTATINSRPFYWTEAGGFRDLIGTAGNSGQTQAISPDGTVVGWYKGTDEVQRAFAWSEATGLVDLNGKIDPALGIHLDSALRVTDDGHIVAAVGDGFVLLSPHDVAPPASTAPVISAIETADVTTIGSPLSATARFTDPDAGDSHRANWDWGDGSGAVAGEVTPTTGGGSVSGQHSYTAVGSYVITLTVIDGAGHEVKSTRTVSVVQKEDSAAGQAVGAGHYVSPPGALRARPDISGRAQIGFVALGHLGGESPLGVVAFQFRAGDLEFQSDDTWSMVIEGGRARIEGSGKVNDVGGYRFGLAAIDGRVTGFSDRVRFEIFAPDGSLFYDNQQPPGSGDGGEGIALTAGSVQVGKRGH